MTKTALIIVGFQNDYFKNGKRELEGIIPAANNAASLLNVFRKKSLPVIHIRHENSIDDDILAIHSDGSKTHPAVKHIEKEFVIRKRHVNSFKETTLKKTLDRLGVRSLLICGTMSHLCIDALTRAAHDYGFDCNIADDACVTSALHFKGTTVPARHVHAAYMAALDIAYANVVSTVTLMKNLE